MSAFRTGKACALGILAMGAAACGTGPAADTADARITEMEARFTPGLHTMMTDLAMRHASLWFAGDAENWALADYMVHELEEVTEHIEDVHPVYNDVPVAALLREMTMPAVEEIEAAVSAGDRAAFITGHDRLTAACNHCHTAAGRGAIVIQRPTAPPLTNVRYAPVPRE
jgi:hypothetical protein